MGVDYFRFRLTQRSPSLETLVRQQSIAYQSMRGWHSDAASDVNDTLRAILEEIHLPDYRAASDEIRSLVDFPPFAAPESDRVTDIPDLPALWRVRAIGGNPIFPPLWRVQAHRTILPDELSDQVGQWTRWATEVADGLHDGYLRWLHLHAMSDFLRYHWSYLRGNAIYSLSKSEEWARSADLAQVRDQILRLPEPLVVAAPIVPSACKVGSDVYQGIQAEVKTINELTRSWNALADTGAKLPDYPADAYHETLNDFRAMAVDDWLLQFLDWAQRCADENFGLYLDY